MVMSEQSKDAAPWWRTDPWNGRHLFYENRNKFPLEELMKYKGQYVAWFPDGSGIFAADPDPMSLRERIKASGDEVAMYLIEYIDIGETYI
jgi:hypothetical protein